MIRLLFPATAMLALSACGSDARQDGLIGVSADEAQALNAAAGQIDARTDAAQGADPGINPAAVMAARAERSRVLPTDGSKPDSP